MARKKWGPGTIRGGGVSSAHPSVKVRTVLGVSRNNPADNMPDMREALMKNIYTRVALPLAAEMEHEARQQYPWQDQDKGTKHTPGKGYPNDNASEQLMGHASMRGDVVVISLAHSHLTFQQPRGSRGGKTARVFYGTILEGTEDEPGKYPILRPIMEEYWDRMESEIAQRAADGIDYSGAKPRRPRSR